MVLQEKKSYDTVLRWQSLLRQLQKRVLDNSEKKIQIFAYCISFPFRFAVSVSGTPSPGNQPEGQAESTTTSYMAPALPKDHSPRGGEERWWLHPQVTRGERVSALILLG